MAAVWDCSLPGFGFPLSTLVVVVVLGHTAELSARELRWRGPTECDQSAYVSEQVEALTGRSLTTIDDYDFAVEIDVAEGPIWRLLLVTKAPGAPAASERRFEGKNCGEVSDAAAVAIAMTLQSGATGTTQAQAPASSATSHEPPSPAEAPPAAEARSRKDAPGAAPSKNQESASALGAHVGLMVVGDAGTLPGMGAGAALSASLNWNPFRFQLEGGFLPSRGTQTTEGRGGEFTLAYGAALACYARVFGGPGPLGCLGYEIGSLSGGGFGVSDPHLGSVLWQALRAETGMNLRLSDAFRIPFRVGAAVPLVRPEFVLDDGEVVHRPNPVALRFQVGFEVSL